MVNFKKLTDQAKQLVDKRGGTEGLKKDASELMNIAKSKGSVGDKAKTAMGRLKRPAHEREGALEAEADAEEPSRRSPVNSRREGDRAPATSSQQPASSGEPPATSSQQQASNQQSDPESHGDEAT